MSPKEKAEELISKYSPYSYGVTERNALNCSIECALITVKEIQVFGNNAGIREPMMYWNSVESELNKMKDEG